MDRIWIAMGMGWGLSLGRGDVGVMLKRTQSKTEARAIEHDHAIRREAISFFGIRCNREVNLTRVALT
jgi:hypothetical protein